MPDLLARFNTPTSRLRTLESLPLHISDTEKKEKEAKEKTNVLIQQKERLLKDLGDLDFIKKIYPSDANFILVNVDDANALYKYLLSKNIVVRNRSSQPLCENCLRVTVGTPQENDVLFTVLKEYDS